MMYIAVILYELGADQDFVCLIEIAKFIPYQKRGRYMPTP